MLEFIIRLFIVYFFVYSGLYVLQNHKKLTGGLKKKLPQTQIIVYGATILSLGGSLAILLNIYTGLFAVLLALCTFIANVFLCDFWNKKGEARQTSALHFAANISIIGGLLMLAIC